MKKKNKKIKIPSGRVNVQKLAQKVLANDQADRIIESLEGKGCHLMLGTRSIYLPGVWSG
jgi:hypothetical protein